MEDLKKGVFGGLIKARREKAQGISRVLPRDGYMSKSVSGGAIPVTKGAVELFQEKYAEKIQPRVERLSRISGLTELELRHLFGRVMDRYVSLLRRAPLSKRAHGSQPTLSSVVEEASRDLPALLSDFEVTVRKVKRWSRQITSSDKLLILRIMQKNNPYVLEQLARDPELQGEFAPHEIKLAVREHRDAKKFLLDSLNMLEKLAGDAGISGIFSRLEIRQAILKNTEGERFLRSILPFVQRGKQILEAAGLTAEAPKTRLYYLICKEFEHKNRIDRLNVLLQTIENSFRTIPYATFEKEISKEMRGRELQRSKIRQQLGAWTAIPRVALDLYLAQFSGLIHHGHRLREYHASPETETVIDNHPAKPHE